MRGFLALLRISFLLIVESQAQFSRFGTCGILTPPRNAIIQGCTRGGREGSRCTVRCEFGFRAEQTVRFCSCPGLFCVWEGNNPTCEDRRCLAPDNENGRMTIVDTWEDGFAGLIEFNHVTPLLRNGWSALIVFNRSLGPNAQMSSWSLEVTAASEENNAFTLSSRRRSRSLTLTYKSHLKSLFVVTGVSGSLPTNGYVGLFNHRIADATCYQPTAMTTMNVMTSLDTSSNNHVTKTQEVSSLTTHQTNTTKTSTSTPTTTATTTTTTTTTTTPRIFYLAARTQSTTIASTVQSETEESLSSKQQVLPTASISPNATTNVSIINATIYSSEIEGMRCVLQRHSKSYRTQRGWIDSTITRFSGNALVLVPGYLLTNWMVVLVFQRPVLSVQVWNTVVEGSEANGLIWKLGPQTFNRDLHGGELDINFIADIPITSSPENPLGEVYLCSLNFPEGDPIRLPNEDGSFPPPGVSKFTYSVLLTTTSTTTTSAANNVSRVDFTYRPDTSSRCQPSSPVGTRATSSAQSRPRWRRSRDRTKYNYNEVLSKSIFFYEAQRSGHLPPKYKRVPWKGSSMMKDGCSVGVDLSRGWFDAGDYVKFTFPMASAVTTLAWGGIEFRSAYRKAGVLIRFLGSVRWPVEYLIKAHLSDNELVALVGNAQVDHASWSRPEDWTQDRPVYTISSNRPGSELAAETAAALASASILLKRSHRTLVTKALRHAKILYDFAKEYRGNYHESVPEVYQFYRSFSGYIDELVWAAAWLYKATGNQTYLAEAEQMYNDEGVSYMREMEYSWDQKFVGAQVLLANLTGKETYRSSVVLFMDRMLTTTQTTPQGMLWLRAHGPTRYAANAAMLALFAYGLEPPLPDRERYLNWARKQIHLLLGDAGRSYVVGFGKDYPERAHHRASSCPPPPAPCDWNTFSSSSPNHFLLHGALVGGPDQKGNYLDSRQNYQQSEVAIDYNAGFQSAIAGLKYYVKTEKPPTSE